MPASFELACSWTEEGEAYLRRKRLEAINLRGELQSIAKTLGINGDREGARLVGDLAKEQMRWYRAACLCLGWYGTDGEAPGDCPPIPPSRWPVELSAEADLLYASATLAHRTEDVVSR